ncbi:glycosyl transferase [Labrys miyagiensis]|uniref:Glycosyl transferase n=1 Tax=Labrys miyagiensis TaxID=346912 RepID=A0ABQ6CET4_9HYPH|nr:glycosyltransferase [Labrys miyagiensis]GLS18173.1 glycosyl transferase [Labrys miyagiensis]
MDKTRISIAIATAGRRDVLTETVRFMARQRRVPDEFLICPARPEDADVAALRQIVPHVRIISSAMGSSHQRNAMIEASTADIMVFFDDDFLPATDFLEETERLFRANPDVVIATGDVLADGANGAGLDFSDGFEVLASAGPNDLPVEPEPIYNGYGCNMAIRLGPVRQYGVRFDENLPLYAWLEDVDFSRQIARYGQIVKGLRLRGVHLGTKKAGRSPGKRLGYSQIANRVYILRKGNMTLKGALEGGVSNLMSNFFRSAWPEPWTDRRGRLAGNVMALWDLVRGRLHPANILKM